MNQIEIFGRHTSYNVQKVLWLADELDLDYIHTEVGGRFGGNDTQSFLQMNPMGKVPVVRDGEYVIWESNTIIRYLADSYSSGNWISTDPYQRSQVNRWLDWSIDELEPAFVGVFWGYYRTPPEQHNKAAITSSVAHCEKCLAQLDRQLDTHLYLLGNTPSLADIATGVFLHRLIAIELTIEITENVCRWYKRLSARDGYRHWVMSDFTELKGRAGY